MLSFLPSAIRGIIAASLLVLNTLLHAPFLIGVSLLRFIVPFSGWQAGCTVVAIWIAEQWISFNSFWMRLTQHMQWDVEGIEQLDKKQWYMVTSNHQSWADIFILQYLLNRKIPMLKFFLKRQLIWVPVIGLCWWALDFPFMKRYSKEYLIKNPHKRGQDMDSTRRACEKFKHTPVSVFNFLEGTRFTSSKHQAQQSPYQWLLKPKAGGIAFVVGALGHSINALVDITIVYPGHKQPSFTDFLCGRVSKLSVRVQQKAIPDDFLDRNYHNDETFRQEFQQWVSQLWQEKDVLMDRLHHQTK
ncbi:acyltransferase [Desulforhopalus sp. 52FAK]